MPRPSYRQMAAHLIREHQLPNYVYTTSPSDESQALINLGENLRDSLKRLTFDKKVSKSMQNFSRQTDKLLANIAKAKELAVSPNSKSEAIKKAAQQVEKDLKEFDRQMKLMAESKDTNLLIFYFENPERQRMYNIMNEVGEFPLDEEDMGVFEGKTIPDQPRRRQPQPQAGPQVQPEINTGNQPEINTEQRQPEPPIQSVNGPQPQPGPQPGPQPEAGPQLEEEEGPQPEIETLNKNNPNLAYPGMDPFQASISGDVQKAAAYAAQAGENPGPDLVILSDLIKGLDKQIEAESQNENNASYVASLKDLRDKADAFLQNVQKLGDTIRRNGNHFSSREALDQSAVLLKAFEDQFLAHSISYRDMDDIEGMPTYDDYQDQVPLEPGRELLNAAGYVPPRTFFPVKMEKEKIIASLTAENMKAPSGENRGIERLKDVYTRMLNFIANPEGKNPQQVVNATTMLTMTTALLDQINNYQTQLCFGETSLAKQSLAKTVAALANFEKAYELYQRYDGEGLASILGDVPARAEQVNYEEVDTVADQILNLTNAQLDAANSRGIQYEAIARSLANGEWEEELFTGKEELNAVSTLIQHLKDNIPGPDQPGVERDAVQKLTESAERMLNSVLELTKEKTHPNLVEAASQIAEFDVKYRAFRLMNPDFAEKYTGEFEKVWSSAKFENPIQLDNEIKQEAPKENQQEPPKENENEQEPPKENENNQEPPKEELSTEEKLAAIRPGFSYVYNGALYDRTVYTGEFLTDEKKRKLVTEAEDELYDLEEKILNAAGDSLLADDVRKLAAVVGRFGDRLKDTRNTLRSGSQEDGLRDFITCTEHGEELDKELKEFNEKHPGWLDAKCRRLANIFQIDDCSKGRQKIHQIGKIRTAYDSIEHLKGILRDPDVSEQEKRDALASIIGIRKLSASVNGKVGNLKRFRISEAEMVSLSLQMQKDPMFIRFLDSMPLQNSIKMACNGSGSKFEDKYREFTHYAFQNKYFAVEKPQPLETGDFPMVPADEEREENIIRTGEIKTAAKWIEAAQKKIKNARSNEEIDLQLARIFAARQLSEAERGKPENIKNTRLYEGQIEQRAKDLLKGKDSDAFTRFLSTMKDAPVSINEKRRVRYRKEYLSEALAGHGGRMEDRFALFCHSVPQGQYLNNRLYERYKPVYYENYTDYVMKHQNPRYQDHARGDVRNDRMKLNHAARMLTAYIMGTESINKYFDKKEFSESCGKMTSSPVFKIMTMTEERCAQLNQGKTDQITDTLTQIVTDFSLPEKSAGVEDRKRGLMIKRAVGDLYYKLVGYREGEQVKKFLAGKSPEFRKMVREAERYANTFDVPNEQDAMRVFASVLDYQKGRESSRGSGENARDFNNSMELAKAVVQGRGAEKYLQEQIDYVNQKRGIDPKDLQNRDRIKLQNIESAIDRRDELENPKPKTIGKGKGIGV